MYVAFRIEAVHRRSGRDLLNLDFLDAPDGAAMVLHPERPPLPIALDLAIVGEPFTVDDDRAEEHFTDDQLRRYSELELAEIERASREPPRPGGSGGPPAAAAVSWSSTRLTFIRRHIEPLAPDQLFAIEVLEEAWYAMTRRQFEETFPNVVASRAYRDFGSYNYKPTPARALRFIVAR
jgi:hypothetical protein